MSENNTLYLRFLEAKDDFSKGAVQDMTYDWGINYVLDGIAEEITKKEFEEYCLEKYRKGVHKKLEAKKQIEKAEEEKLKNFKEKKKGKLNYTPKWLELLQEVEEEIVFYFDKNSIWWMWDEEKYKWEICDETDILVEIIKKYPATNITNQKTKAELVNSMKLFGRSRKLKSPKARWIQFKDKVFNIETKEIFPVSKEFFFTNPLPYRIGNSEETPNIDKLFNEWVEPKYVQMLYEIIAYCLYRDYPIHRIFCFTGSGRNGKSKYLGLISNLLGDHNTTTSDLDLLMSRPFESFKLYKKLICQMGETNYEGLKRTAILKQLSGQDMISYEKKGKDGFTDYNYAKLLISTNGIPITHDKSDGFYRRWLIVDFPNNFPEGKDILKSIPDEEYENLCKKCINILPKLLEEGKFTNEPSIDEKKKMYEEKSNPLMLYIEKHMVKDFNSFVGKTEMYSKFLAWLNSNGYRSMNYNEFSGLMKLEFDEAQKGNEKTRSWVGLRYLEKDDYRGESNASNASNVDFQSETYIEKLKENSVTSVTSVTNNILSSIRTILLLSEEIEETDLLNKLRQLFEFRFEEFAESIDKLKEIGEIIENPKGTYKRL